VYLLASLRPRVASKSVFLSSRLSASWHDLQRRYPHLIGFWQVTHRILFIRLGIERLLKLAEQDRLQKMCPLLLFANAFGVRMTGF
jgi:hypothetical protein